VASALDAAHERGLVHRDIKPANVLVEPPAGSLGERAYLTDFGLTKRLESISVLTKTGQFLGSVEYAAPEQFEGKPLDARTDVYSLGCVAYECLTGQVPFSRDSEAAVMYAHLRDPPPPVTAARPDLPAAVDTVVAQAMAKAPAQRHPSAGRLAQALEAAVRAEPSGPQPPAPAGGPWRVVIAAVAAVLLVAGAVVGVLVARDGSKAPSGPPTVPAAFAGVVELDPSGRTMGVRIPLSLVHSDTLFEKQIAVGEGFEWVADGTANTVYKISLTNHTVVFKASLSKVLGFAFARGKVWMSQGSPITDDRTLVRIDPTRNSVSPPIQVGEAHTLCCGGVAVADGFVWVLTNHSLIRVDPSTAKVQGTIHTGGERLVAASGKLWILNALAETLYAVDPRTGRVAQRISLSGTPTAAAIGFGAAWVAEGEAGTVSRIPLNGEGGTDVVRVGKSPNDIAIGGGVVWVANAKDGTVSRIPGSGGTASSFHVGGFPTHIAAGASGVWVLIEASLPAA